MLACLLTEHRGLARLVFACFASCTFGCVRVIFSGVPFQVG